MAGVEWRKFRENKEIIHGSLIRAHLRMMTAIVRCNPSVRVT